MGKFFDLSFEQLPDGVIRLEQDPGFDETSVIDLHPWQLRAVAEHFGLAHNAPPADELTKLYAEQLCRVFLVLADDFRDMTPKMEAEWNRLDAFVDQMPSSLFPSHLWDEREQAAEAHTAKASASKTTVDALESINEKRELPAPHITKEAA